MIRDEHAIELANANAKIVELKTLAIADRVKAMALVDKKDAEIVELRDEIQQLAVECGFSSGRIHELMDAKPQTVTNVVGGVVNLHPKLADIPTVNIRPLTIETVREDVHKYGYTEFLRGLPGLVKFVEDIIIEPRGDGGTTTSDDSHVAAGNAGEPYRYARNYVCTDASRNKFHRLVESKEWSADGGAMFIHSILNELRDITDHHFIELVGEERAAVSDEFQRSYIDAQKAMVKPVFYGITGEPTSEDRMKLFKALRGKIRDAAMV